MSLVAHTEDLFYETCSFYIELGFVEISVYDRALPSQKRHNDHCLTSEKETWLLSQADDAVDGGNGITLKIRFVSDVRHWKDGTGNLAQPPHLSQQPQPKSPSQDRAGQHEGEDEDEHEHDWRGSKNSWVFTTPHLDRVLDLLRAKNHPFQCQPDGSDMVEVYTRDPLGVLVGFTRKVNPFTTCKTPTIHLLPVAAGSSASSSSAADCMIKTPSSRPDSPGGSASGGRRKRIAVMTSGGDAPGMNAAVRAVVRMTIAKGCESYAIYEGYEGMVKGGSLIKKMEWEDVRGWLSEGGTLIGTARCKAFRERPGRLAAAKNLILNGIDAVIICGGDGSLTGADLFRSEWPGLLRELVDTGDLQPSQVAPFEYLAICGLVGSIDNDMTGTDATIGCYSSLTRICQAVDYIDATAYSHSRAFVVEVMGRHCGWLALMAGVSTGADFVFLPEKPPAQGWENEMCAIISKVRATQSTFGAD